MLTYNPDYAHSYCKKIPSGIENLQVQFFHNCPVGVVNLRESMPINSVPEK